MTKKYPLDQLESIKKKRLEEAEKVLEEKKRILKQEEAKLLELEEERDKVKAHKMAKLAQLREKLDEGTTTDKIQQMKQYLKVVDEKLKVEQNKVAEQKKIVDKAAEQVEIARQDYFKKQKDVEKLKLHHTIWSKEMKVETDRMEAADSDEIGGAMHVVRKVARRHRKN